MEKHFELTDTEFEAQFANCALDPSLFSHEAHLRLAWIHITKYGLEQAEENIQTQLKNYVAQLGAQDKYHTTVTVAAIKAVYHFIQKSQTKSFKAFIADCPRLKENFKELMGAHYNFDIFGSKEARQAYIEPDSLPF